jgi:hypothetical protein
MESRLILLPASAGFFLGSLFDLEDGGSILLSTAGFSLCMALHPRRLYPSTYITTNKALISMKNVAAESLTVFNCKYKMLTSM